MTKLAKILTMPVATFQLMFPSQTIDKTLNDPLIRVRMNHAWYRLTKYDIDSALLTFELVSK